MSQVNYYYTFYKDNIFPALYEYVLRKYVLYASQDSCGLILLLL